MKAKELMIGDWVSMHYPFDMDIDMRPERINVLSIGVDVDCKPIPLTAEILKKNGFEVHRQFATFTEYWLDIPRKRVRVAPNSYIEIYNGGNKNVHIDGKSYVHELQHALRLCGIDKEIVL